MSVGRALLIPTIAVGLAHCSAQHDDVDGGTDARFDGFADVSQDATGDALQACGPVDVSSYQPPPLTPPNAPHANKCTTQQISDYAQCQGAKVTSYCGEFADGQPGQTCRECIETQSTAMRWGVIVFTGNTGSFNIEGCVDDALSQVSQEKQNGGNGSCGDALFASYGCQDAACAACKGDALDTCATAALQSGCKTYDAVVESKTGPCSVMLGDAAPPAVQA